MAVDREWRSGTLSDFAGVLMGTSPSGETCNESGKGLPLLNGPTEFGGHHPVAVQFTTAPVRTCETGDILFCVRGSTTGRMNWADRSYAIGRGLAAIRHRRDPSLQPFVRAVIEWRLPSVLAVATGSTFPSVSRSDIEGIECPVPPLPEQKRISHILGTLDDKIELNRRMNATLEGISRAIFKSWFESTDSSTLQASVSDLADAGVLQVGDGYRAKNDELGDEGLPFARAGNIDNGFTFADVDHLLPSSVAKAGEKISQPFDVVFTSKGTVGRFAFVPPAMPSFVFSPQLCYWRSVDHARLHPHVLFHWMQSRAFLDQVDRVKGQTDMAEYVSLRDQRRMEMSVPDSSAQAVVAPSLERLQARIWANTSETKTLAALRDALLPKLLSGEIRIHEADQAVEEVFE
jgi:type I restriction enzyme S subunit